MSSVVLLVDDDDDFLRLCSRTLKNAGYDVQEARNYLEALQMARDCDVMILDILIGIPDGEAVLSCIRSDKNMVPVIGISGAMPSEETIRRMTDMGMFRFLEKSRDLTALLKTVKEAITLKKAMDTTEKTCTNLERIFVNN